MLQSLRKLALQVPTHQGSVSYHERVNKTSALSIEFTEKKILSALVTVLARTEALNSCLEDPTKNSTRAGVTDVWVFSGGRDLNGSHHVWTTSTFNTGYL